ncbi:MAG: hypothetical protein IJW97_03475 [Clostridia bacterium]|nr:hypothetical protein [Clostridia bacterium]
MKTDLFFELLADVDDAYIEHASLALSQPLRRPATPHRALLAAACIALVAALPLGWMISKHTYAPTDPGIRDEEPSQEQPDLDEPTEPVPEDVPNGAPTGDEHSGAPSVTIDGELYMIAATRIQGKTCPEGFTLSGRIDGFPYYTNPDIPYWVYVYHDTVYTGSATPGSIAYRTEAHKEYVLYVHESVRGNRFLRYNGTLYIRLHDALYTTFTDHPIADPTLLRQYEQEYDVGFATLPDGFISVGTASLYGYCTVPLDELSSNFRSSEVYVNPDFSDFILQEARISGMPLYEIFIPCGTGLQPEQLPPWLRSE